MRTVVDVENTVTARSVEVHLDGRLMVSDC
jgi:hypothetical protein